LLPEGIPNTSTEGVDPSALVLIAPLSGAMPFPRISHATWLIVMSPRSTRLTLSEPGSPVVDSLAQPATASDATKNKTNHEVGRKAGMSFS
jgi:hypothetical protein